MTDLDTRPIAGDVRPPAGDGVRPSAAKAFRAILWRDVFVTGKEFWVFLAQVALQPLFMLFVFAKVLNAGGYVTDDYAHLLLPGIVALTAFLTALQTVSFPLIMEFSFTREIEDRLLAPLPTDLVAVEKVVFATVRALFAAGIMFPLGRWMLGPLGIGWAEAPAILGLLVLGALVGSAVGLALGTLVQPQKMQIVFALALAPLMFTGAIQFPWPSLDGLRWFQVLCALNPLTYVSEAMRGVLLDDVPHIPVGLCVLLLFGFLGGFGYVGVRGFRKRALD
jgi:ABC-2 type transport system permease protein